MNFTAIQYFYRAQAVTFLVFVFIRILFTVCCHLENNRSHSNLLLRSCRGGRRKQRTIKTVHGRRPQHRHTEPRPPQTLTAVVINYTQDKTHITHTPTHTNDTHRHHNRNRSRMSSSSSIYVKDVNPAPAFRVRPATPPGKKTSRYRNQYKWKPGRHVEQTKKSLECKDLHNNRYMERENNLP